MGTNSKEMLGSRTHIVQFSYCLFGVVFFRPIKKKRDHIRKEGRRTKKSLSLSCCNKRSSFIETMRCVMGKPGRILRRLPAGSCLPCLSMAVYSRPTQPWRASFLLLPNAPSLPDGHTCDRRQPAVGYRWTGWVWETTGSSLFKTAQKLPIILEEFLEYTPIW